MILDRFRLTDKVAIVTGASAGIGRASALAFADAGAHVVCAARTPERLQAVAAEIGERGRRALVVDLPLSHKDIYDSIEQGSGVGYQDATLDVYKGMIELREAERRANRR